MRVEARPRRVAGWVLRGIATGAMVVGLSVPVASAKSSSRVHLSLIPLPKLALGSAARGLKLAFDSGPSSTRTNGQIGGYVLHYGNEASGKPGVDSVTTRIDEYKNAKAAERGLAAAKSEDAQVKGLNYAGLSVKFRKVKVPAIGSASFADVASYSASNIAPVSIVTEWFTEGRYLLEARVAARTAAEAKATAPAYAEELAKRLERARKGRLHARAVKLAPRPKPGPPAGGPSLSAMGLQTSDLTGPATLIADTYLAEPPAAEPDPLALSQYFEAMQPAGPFNLLIQHIEWFPTANEASFDADRWLAGEAAPIAHPFDLTGVGDNARCVYLSFGPGIVALVTFSTGHLTEILELDNPTDLPLSNIASVAQAAANDINAIYKG